MAEELGTAVLRITVDDKAAKDSLRELRRNISAATKLSSGGRAAIQEDERRFQIAQRIKRLEKEGVDVTRLRSRLQDANRARLNGDLETQRRITAELGRQVQLVERRFRPRAQGGASESVLALEKAQERRFRLAQKIDRLENQGADVSRLRSGLGKVTEALANREFEAQRRLSVELSRQVRLTEARLRLQRDTERETRRVARAEITEGRRVGRLNTSPVRGGIAFPGSPEARAATLAADQAIVSRNLKVRTSWAKALDFLDDTAALIAFNAKAAVQAEGRRIGKLNVSPVGGSKLIPGSPAFLDAIFPAFPKDYFAKQRAAEAEGLRIGRLNTAPVRGGAAFAGSPAFLDSIFPKFPKEYFAKQAREVKAASQKQQGIISNAIIGGAFPLLFGQGIGASIGGAAGGAAGGAIGGQFGFGLSLVGTALGAQFDAAIQKSGELAKALDKPIAQFGALQQGALLSSKGVEKQIEALITSGRQAEAAALIQQDLNKVFGDAQGAKEYQSAVDRLNRSYTQATVTLTNFVAGPLASLLERISGPTRNTQLSARLLSQRARLTPEQTKEFAAFTAAEKRRQNIGIGSSSVQITAFYASLLEKITEIQGKNNNALAVAARNQKVLTQSAQTLVGLEADISRARISGNKPLADSLSLQSELLKNYRERKNIEQQLAAKDISAGQSTELTRQSFARDKQLQQDYVNTTRQAAADAVKELQVTKQLVGLDGVRLDVARKRLDIDDAADTLFKRRTEFINARETLATAPTNLNKTLAQGAFQEFVTAGAQFETKLRQAADYLTKAAKDAAQNLTTSILNLGKLEASPTGLNRFLTPNEQFESTRKAILRLGEGAGTAQGSQLENAITKATELLNLTRGQANERFQGLRDIFTQARQGVFASEAGFNVISQFIEDTRARSQAVTGLGDAQKTLADITSLSASVQQELVGAVRENSLLLSNLFGKDWSVNVSVAGAEANITGDVTNRQISP